MIILPHLQQQEKRLIQRQLTRLKKTKAPVTSESTPTKKTSFLPKTGEQRKVWLTVIGGAILVIVLFILIRKKKNSTH